MNVKDVVEDLHRQGIEIRPTERGTVLLEPGDRVTDEVKALVVANKPALLAYLRSRPAYQTAPAVQPTRRPAKKVYWSPNQILTLLNTTTARGEKSHAEALNLSLAWLELQHQIPVGSA